MTASAQAATMCGELESHRVFAGVCSETIAAHCSVFTYQHVRRSSIIFDQGDDASDVFLVLTGRIALNRIAPCGKVIAPALLGPGSIVGDDALSPARGGRSARATAITESAGLRVAASDLMRIVAHDGTVASNIVRILALQHEAMAATLEDLATLNVVDRIARFFARLAAPSDGPWSGTARVDVPLTHDQIAAFVSSSRETVCLEMGRLVRAGRVIRDRDGYAVRGES